MTDDNYRPPQAEVEDELMSATGGQGSFEIGVCLSDAWRDTWASFPLWLGVGLVFLLTAALSTLTVIGIPFLLPILLWGGVAFCLNVRDRRESFSDLFSGFTDYWPKLGRMLLWILLYILISIPGSIAQMLIQGDLSSTGRMALGYVVGAAWGLLVTIRFLFSMFFVVDRDLGAVESLHASWRVTSNQHLRLIGLFAMNYVLMIAGLIALVVG